MTQIIPIGKSDFAGCPKQTVNARELHAFLENRDHFSTWIKDRISQYGFVENQDFVIASGNSEAIRGGHNRLDYFLSLDMAKELSMVERNAKGKQARQYFIDCEKRLSGSLKIDFNDPLQAAKAFIEAETARRDAERKLQIAGGALTRLGAAKGSQCLRESAKLLKWKQTPFIDWLLARKMLFRDAGKQLCVYQEYLGRGWFEYRTDEKNGHAFKQVMVTPLGLQKLAQKLEIKEAV